ncbi:MAG: hypothetical protein DRJ42_09100 [Deltaproteobacteria bacterium]|nr:MAG: hypothetical protein DRJ42_09100 [Deltaproteobacteria bacterium]
MTTAPHRQSLPTRLFLVTAIVALPLFGRLAAGCHEEDGLPEVTRCSAESALRWTPDRIAIYDASSFEEVGDGASVAMITGAQGSDMVGLELTVFGDAIPGCIEARLGLDGYFDEAGPLRLETNADGSASVLVYGLAELAGPSRATATVGDLSVAFDVDVVR